jgi:hypothetical protein
MPTLSQLMISNVPKNTKHSAKRSGSKTHTSNKSSKDYQFDLSASNSGTGSLSSNNGHVTEPNNEEDPAATARHQLYLQLDKLLQKKRTHLLRQAATNHMKLASYKRTPTGRKHHNSAALYKLAARRPVSLILVDPFSGKILKNRAFRVRMASKLPNGHGRSKREFKK